MSGLTRENQDVVDLYKYSTLSKVLHLALKVENQLKRKQEAKKSTSYNDYYSKPWHGKEKKDFKTPSKSSHDPTPKPNSLGLCMINQLLLKSQELVLSNVLNA